MAVTTVEHKDNYLRATTEDGIDVVLSQKEVTTKIFYNVKEMNGRLNTMGLFEKLSKVSKSSKDIEVMGKIIDSADRVNAIHIHNMGKYAETVGCGRESLKKLLQRANEHNLLHKIETGHYLLNPYILMSKGLTSGNYQAQEDAQINWARITGTITDKQMQGIVKLGEYLGLTKPLRITEFSVSVGEYYMKNGKITDKQKAVLVKQ